MAVVGELVITGKGDKTSERGAKRVEDLRGSVGPHLDALEGVQLWLDVELNSLGSSVESGTPDQEDEQDKVGEQGSEVNDLEKQRSRYFGYQSIFHAEYELSYLSRRLDSLDETEADDDPSTSQAKD